MTGTVHAREDGRSVAVSAIEEVIEDFSKGRMVILVDDEDRENEGDLLIAAECVRAEHINFMVSHGRGLVCLTLTEDRCRRLNLPLMVNNNNARYATNFTVSIEAAEGVTTGISAADRATTVRAAVNAGAGPSDIVSPGHIFPIMAQPGGVLTRAGHTEAGTDLARICGFEPASVICEILNADGSVARLPDLVRFGEHHGLRIGAIADLIRYRLRREATVRRIAEHAVTTVHGEFQALAYQDDVAGSVHLALVRGDIRRDRPTPVRVQVHAGVLDALREARGEARWTVARALARVARHGYGIVILLEYREDVSSVARKLRDLDVDPDDSDSPGDLRMVGAGSQILADLGAGRVLVLGTPKRAHGLSGFGLEVVDYLADPEN
jgi:3,4-dihydroxy 2-butanone 4-phosphate synthase/GTP cyclohydrolase II